MLLPLLGAALALFLAGCASPQARIKERPDAYASLPKKFQEAASHGEVMEGMNTDAVYFALGRPARTLHGLKKGVKLETWIYTHLRSEEVPVWRNVSGRTADGTRIVYQEYDRVDLLRVRDAFEVNFENGKVTGWQEKDEM